MADYGVEVVWREAHPGREKQALALWADSVAINDKYVANGELERWEGVIYDPAATGPAGSVRLYGTDQQVEAFIRSEDFTNIMLRASMLLNEVGIRRFMTGQALVDGFIQYATVVESL